MLDLFKEGGWGMFPTLFSGLLLLGVSASYALKPEMKKVPLLISMGILTLMAGSMGFVSGVIVTMHAIAHVQPDERWIAMLGVGESLTNLGLAFALMTVSALATTVGAWRLSRQAAPAL
jgi:hypothetical protein